MGSSRGRTFKSLGELKVAVLEQAVAELADIWKVPVSAVREAPERPAGALYATEGERKAKDIFDRLQTAMREAVAFAAEHKGQWSSYPVPGLGAYGNLLRSWGPMFEASPLAIQFLFLPPDVAALPNAGAELTNLVRWWDEQSFGVARTDRTLALLVLRGGWWPEKMSLAEVQPNATVANVISTARHAVTAARKGK